MSSNTIQIYLQDMYGSRIGPITIGPAATIGYLRALCLTTYHINRPLIFMYSGHKFYPTGGNDYLPLISGLGIRNGDTIYYAFSLGDNSGRGTGGRRKRRKSNKNVKYTRAHKGQTKRRRRTRK